ncbi:MAG: heme exporter protein CcmD [Cohaesibacteraceae bacterium]|nr:heme exporter protein CcmD [Cohaesibacteraceae bacterium]
MSAHAGYIIASYLSVGLLVFGMIGWIILDGRRQNRILSDLERRGIHRRSRKNS